MSRTARAGGHQRPRDGDRCRRDHDPQNYIGGRWVASGRHPLRRGAQSRHRRAARAACRSGSAADVDRAVQAALKAYPGLARDPAGPPGEAAVQAQGPARGALRGRRAHGARASTARRSTSRAVSVRRAIDNVDIALGDSRTRMHGHLARGHRDRHRLPHRAPAARRVRGDHAVQLPGHGADVVPALRGRVRQHVHRQAERARAALAGAACSRCMHEAGFPEGVVNLVHGAKEAVDGILDHPGIAGVSFVGSSPVAHYVYKRGAESGKRVQALGGAKNFVVVMPDADMDRARPRSRPSRASAAPASAASRTAWCSRWATPTTGSATSWSTRRRSSRWATARSRASRWARSITAQHREKVLGYIEQGIKEGAKLVPRRPRLQGPEAPGRLLPRPVDLRRREARTW